MGDQLSGIAVIICIALGVLTVVLLFIFGKRQIMRFALKSSRGPHVPVACDAPKSMRQEIERRLDVVSDIQCEPKIMKKEHELLLSEYSQALPNSRTNLTSHQLSHIYRMKAVDSLTLLDKEIAVKDPSRKRMPGQDVRIFLVKLAHGSHILAGFDIRLIHEFADLYEHARHEPIDFTYDHLNRYLELLSFLCHWISDGKRSHTTG